MRRINCRRHGLFICAFNRFRIKGPPLPGHADWQEIARHPARHPKNRYELRRRDKIVFRFAVPPAAPLLFPLVGIDDIAPMLRDDSFFLRIMANAGRIHCALGEIPRSDTIELSYCKSLFQSRLEIHVRHRKRERARPASMILISDES